jgi:hypothetical protein
LNDESFLDLVEELLAKYGPKWQYIADQIGDRPERIRSAWRRSGRELPDREDNPESELALHIEFTDKKETNNVDWREYIDLAKHGKDINERSEITQKTAEVHIKTDKPIAVVYSGDWHLGDKAIDYQTWVSHLSLILNNNNVFMVDMGDEIQNMRTFKVLSGVLDQVLSPTQQAAMLHSIVDELTESNKLLAKITGNHDAEFDERLFGEALEKYYMSKLKAPIFNNRGLLDLHVGDQLYPNLLFHKSRFKSSARPAQGALKEWQMGYPAEVVVGGHDHIPAAEIMWAYGLASDNNKGFGGEIFLLKIGTFQDSDLGWKYYQGSNPTCIMPTVVYYPKEHRKILFMDLADAIKFLKE